MRPARAGGAVAAAADDAAVGLDVNLQDGCVLGAREVGERLAAARAALLGGGQALDFFGGRQRAIIAAAVAGLSPLLSPRQATGAGRGGRGRFVGAGRGGGGVGWRVRRGVGGRVGRWQLVRRGAGFGTAPEELLAEEAELGLEFGDTGVELRFALAGALMHGPPVADLLAEVEELALVRAGGTGRWQGRGRGGGGGGKRNRRGPGGEG